MNIIGDIAGNYDTLMALIKKMPSDKLIVSVGDMIDRGPNSRQVIEWFMANGKAIMGNHEHMMVDARRHTGLYQSGTWQWNGAGPTLDSFKLHIPDEVIEWVEGLPLFIEEEGLLVTHSFVKPGLTLQQACNVNVIWYDSDNNIIWNRSYPERMEGKFQIAGHNSQFGLKWFSDDKGQFAVCIDSSRERVLTGIHWPSLQIYQQAYID